MNIRRRAKISPVSKDGINGLCGMESIPKHILIPIWTRRDPGHARYLSLIPPNPATTSVDHPKSESPGVIEYVPDGTVGVAIDEH